jgi:hypothetical protein
MSPIRTVVASRLLPIILMILVAAGAAPAAQSAKENKVMTIDEIKHAVLGDWISIAPEERPSALKNPDGTLKPFYLKRDFKALPSDQFELTLVNSADPLGKVPLARILIKGHMIWRGDHPIAAGAQKVDFVADEAYEVTPPRRVLVLLTYCQTQDNRLAALAMTASQVEIIRILTSPIWIMGESGAQRSEAGGPCQ